MSLYSQFKTDQGVEKTGILLEYGDNERTGKPICIRIARAGGANKMYEKLMEGEIKPYRRSIQNDTIELAVINRILKKVFARTVVLGWENVDLQEVDEKTGKVKVIEDAPFSVENCLKLFEDLPDLFKDIQEQSQRAALFRAEVRDAEAKN